MTKSLTTTKAKRIWRRVLLKHMNNSVYDHYLESVVPKLLGLKFGRNGIVKKTRYVKGKGEVQDKYYEYVSRCFPSLLRIFEEELIRKSKID